MKAKQFFKLLLLLLTSNSFAQIGMMSKIETIRKNCFDIRRIEEIGRNPYFVDYPAYIKRETSLSSQKIVNSIESFFEFTRQSITPYKPTNSTIRKSIMKSFEKEVIEFTLVNNLTSLEKLSLAGCITRIGMDTYSKGIIGLYQPEDILDSKKYACVQAAIFSNHILQLVDIKSKFVTGYTNVEDALEDNGEGHAFVEVVISQGKYLLEPLDTNIRLMSSYAMNDDLVALKEDKNKIFQKNMITQDAYDLGYEDALED